MNSKVLDKNAIVSEIVEDLNDPEEYTRGILEKIYACRRLYQNVSVRIGVLGKGYSPHYRIEYSDISEDNGEKKSAIPHEFGAYDGRNHKPLGLDLIHQPHWSSRTMTFDEVKKLLGTIRNYDSEKFHSDGKEELAVPSAEEAVQSQS